MGLLFSEALNWQLTRLSSRQSVRMDSRVVDVPWRTEQHSFKPVAGNSVGIWSCQEPMSERVWWSLLPTWEAGGSGEARAFVSQLAKAKAGSAPHELAGRVRQASHRRCSSILACAAARAFALSILEKRPALGCDGDTPSPSEVVGACRHLPLDSVS